MGGLIMRLLLVPGDAAQIGRWVDEEGVEDVLVVVMVVVVVVAVCLCVCVNVRM